MRITYYLFALTALSGVLSLPEPRPSNAWPEPARAIVTPPPRAVDDVEKRQMESLISQVTAGFADVTAAGGSVFSVATAAAGSALSVASVGAESIFSEISEYNGRVFTVLSDGAGHALTLAESGAGVATSLAGTAFRAATAAVGSQTANSALLPLYLPAPVMVSLSAVLAGVFMGAARVIF